jgi:hypothetical protein
VSKPDKDMMFAASPSGLYYHNTTNCAVVMINTVRGNREGLTYREFHRATVTHRDLGLVGHPSSRDFKNMVRSNMIKNCNVTASDIDNAYKPFGDDIFTLGGEVGAVRNTQDAVIADYVAI